MKNVVMISFWRDDAQKDIWNRIDHLLAKGNENTRWLWVVGDCADTTERILRHQALKSGKDITIIRYDTMIEGSTMKICLKRLGASANAALSAVKDTDDYVLIHESDLVSPANIVDQFVDHAKAGRLPIAGMPMLGNQFYDVWAYRANGEHFIPHLPYHTVYNSSALFQVDSVGSCWMFDAKDADIRMVNEGVVDVCKELKRRGREIWVDPTIRIEQPKALFKTWNWVEYEKNK